MDRIDLFSASRAPAPLVIPDQRPTADAAAIARDTRPAIPLAVAAVPGKNLSQTAEVTKSLLRAETTATTDPSLPLDKRIDELQRTLKPYGVSMLPDSRAAERAKAAEARARTAEARAQSARAEADDAADSAARPAAEAGEPSEPAASSRASPAVAAGAAAPGTAAPVPRNPAIRSSIGPSETPAPTA